jgi:hypothetical protein
MNRVIRSIVRVSIVAVALMVLEWLLGFVVRADRPAAAAGGVVAGLGLQLLRALVLAAPLAFPIGRSRLGGRTLLGAVFWPCSD